MGSGVSKDGVGLIDENLDTLLRCTNINVKIIACLQADNVLSEEQVSEIVTEQALLKQCQLLYGWMKHSVKLFNCFVEVMGKNEQSHVANLLKQKNNEPHVPLSDSRYERMIRIKPKLMESIHYSEVLVASLQATTAISETDCQDVRVDVLTKYKKNYILINAIQRRSDYSFICFERALRETHQNHVADYLYKGAVVAVHVKTKKPELDDKLSQGWNDIIVKECAAPTANGTLSQVSNETDCQLLSTKPGKSIVIFLYCKTTDNMTTLVKSFKSGQLKLTIERILRDVLLPPHKPTDISVVKLSLDEEEVLLIKEFSGIDVVGDQLEENFDSSNPGQAQSSDSVIKEIKEEEVVKPARVVDRPIWRP